MEKTRHNAVDPDDCITQLHHCVMSVPIARYTVYVKDNLENYTWFGTKKEQKYGSQQDQLNQ